MTTDINKTASTWVEYIQAGPGLDASEDKLWAHSDMFDLCRKSPEESWRVVVRILDLTDRHMTLATLGAGPIEDMLLNFPGFTIEKIEAEFRRNIRLQEAVDSVWKSNIPDEIWKRLQVLRGTVEPTWE